MTASRQNKIERHVNPTWTDDPLAVIGWFVNSYRNESDLVGTLIATGDNGLIHLVFIPERWAPCDGNCTTYPECDTHVQCDEDCLALLNPETNEELRAALEHWRSHGYVSGCSHGC